MLLGYILLINQGNQRYFALIKYLNQPLVKTKYLKKLKFQL